MRNSSCYLCYGLPNSDNWYFKQCRLLLQGEHNPKGMEEFSVSVVEALCLGTSLTISGIFYYVYRKKKKTVDKLKVRSEAT